MSTYDRSFFLSVQQRFTISHRDSSGVTRLRKLSDRELTNLLAAVERGRARDEEIAADLQIPLATVTQIYDEWIVVYDPPRPKRETLKERLQREAQEEWERDTQ